MSVSRNCSQFSPRGREPEIVDSPVAGQICTVMYERVIDKRVVLVIRANQSWPLGLLPIAPPPLNCSRRKGSKALLPFADRASGFTSRFLHRVSYFSSSIPECFTSRELTRDSRTEIMNLNNVVQKYGARIQRESAHLIKLIAKVDIVE